MFSDPRILIETRAQDSMGTDSGEVGTTLAIVERQCSNAVPPSVRSLSDIALILLIADLFLQSEETSARHLGHEIPPELLSGYYTVLVQASNTSQELMLGDLALTCRYWARQIRPKILADLYVKNKSGVLKMRAALDLPKGFRLPHPLLLVGRLHIVCNDSIPSWIHRVCWLIQRVNSLRRSLMVVVHIDNFCNSPDPSAPAPRSLFYYLPRSCPAISEHFYRLVLTNTRFRQAGDMFRLVSQMTNLRCLKVAGVTWDLSSPRIPPPPLPTFLETIVVHEAKGVGRDGSQGIIPWFVDASVNFHPVRYASKKYDRVPSLLDPRRVDAPTIYPTHPTQSKYITDVLDVLTRTRTLSHRPVCDQRLGSRKVVVSKACFA